MLHPGERPAREWSSITYRVLHYGNRMVPSASRNHQALADTPCQPRATTRRLNATPTARTRAL